ncbi:YiaA/YiaB family inner membrane protein [Ahrensia sp. R2A130]|uniref:YiaA/YiaB family inner membrane protein n=1 Tax=Ahrensia sp. R2A130 TaxID=744979 RepID=UPI0001E08C7E|nr:YiaA/YiaB family inner membrane protein [Ahrensia sp. R2A130]EFL89107.1 YiaA/B two helix domain-containing protein [Ahrensia sp. R2A130]
MSNPTNVAPTAPAMNAFSMFTFISFGVSALMMAGGIYFMEASFAAKGFYAMSAIMLVHTTISLSKTLRDQEEQRKLHNRIDEARAERLLMETRDGDLL